MKERNEQLLAWIAYAVSFAIVVMACKWLVEVINQLPD
jgi:hypothetical protein